MAYKTNQVKPQMVFDKDTYSELEKELEKEQKDQDAAAS